MNNEEDVLLYLETHGKVSPALVQNKMNVTYVQALELCGEAYRKYHREWFFIRNFGKSYKEMEKIYERDL